MLDLVPLALPRWYMADGDLQSGVVGQPLQFQFPEPHSGPVASSGSAVISSFPARVYASAPIDSHQRRMLWAAKAASDRARV